LSFTSLRASEEEKSPKKKKLELKLSSSSLRSPLSKIMEKSASEVIPPKQKLISVKSTDLIPKVLKILIENNIYSAPVYNKTTKTYTGFIDLVDIVSFIVGIFTETELLGEDFDLFLLEEKQNRFSQQHADKVEDLSKRNPFHAVKDSASVLQVLEIFEKTGTHRVALVKDNGDIVNVITQSAIVSFFESYITQLGPAARKTLHFHFPLDKELISIKSSDQAIDAFKLMDKKTSERSGCS